MALTTRRYRWYHVLGALSSILFCLEFGLFLAVLPWSDFWGKHGYLKNIYLRGALSGLGVASLLLAILQVLRLRRFQGNVTQKIEAPPLTPPAAKSSGSSKIYIIRDIYFNLLGGPLLALEWGLCLVVLLHIAGDGLEYWAFRFDWRFCAWALYPAIQIVAGVQAIVTRDAVDSIWYSSWPQNSPMVRGSRALASGVVALIIITFSPMQHRFPYALLCQHDFKDCAPVIATFCSDPVNTTRVEPSVRLEDPCLRLYGPIDMDFGKVRVGGPVATRSFTVENAGEGVLSLRGTKIVKSQSGNAADVGNKSAPKQATAFVLDGPHITTLLPHDRAVFHVTFRPIAAGPDKARITVLTNEPSGIQGGYRDREVEVSGEGVIEERP